MRRRGLEFERGQDLIEYAIIAPMLVMLTLGVVEFALFVFSYNTISEADREGARYGIVHPTDTVGIETAARRLTLGLKRGALLVQSSLPGGNTVRVDVTYDAPVFTGFIMQLLGGSPTLRMRAVSTMQIE
jgi:Flp pilus assembly protein TadG